MLKRRGGGSERGERGVVMNVTALSLTPPPPSLMKLIHDALSHSNAHFCTDI